VLDVAKCVLTEGGKRVRGTISVLGLKSNTGKVVRERRKN